MCNVIIGFKKLLPLVFAFFLTLSFAGCGGGTSGTGGNDVLARLIETSGAALANVQVSVLESGEQAVTDAEGKFELRLPKDKKSTLLFESERGSAQAEIDSALFPAEKVTIEFIAEEDLSVVTVNKIEAADSNAEEEEQEQGDTGTRTVRRQAKGSALTPRGFEIVLQANFREVSDMAGPLSRELQLTGLIPLEFSVNEEKLSQVRYLVQLPSKRKCLLSYQNSDGTNGIFKLTLSVSRSTDGALVEKADLGECQNFGSLDLEQGQLIRASISRMTLGGYMSTVVRFVAEMQGK